MMRHFVTSTSAPSLSQPESLETRNKLNQAVNQEENSMEDKESERKDKKTKSSKYRPFKNTALVLRDVKNSIELRMKARHESKSFAKLTNELATPPTKLYSPFNIYTPSCSGGKGTPGTALETKGLTRSARRSKLSKKREKANKLALDNSMTTTLSDSGLDCSMVLSPASAASTTTSSETSDADRLSMTAQGRTPKERIALRHKKHLQTNAFASFASPTGRLRETVKEVEQFQQCIEDISLAIRARGRSN